MPFNPAILSTKITWVTDVDSVTITRTSQSISGGAVVTGVTTIFSGTADFQEGVGDTYYNEQGTVEEADATLYIDATPLPAVLVGDTVTSPAGKPYTVVGINNQPFALPHIQIMVKRGGIDNKQG